MATPFSGIRFAGSGGGQIAFPNPRAEERVCRAAFATSRGPADTGQ